MEQGSSSSDEEPVSRKSISRTTKEKAISYKPPIYPPLRKSIVPEKQANKKRPRPGPLSKTSRKVESKKNFPSKIVNKLKQKISKKPNRRHSLASFEPFKSKKSSIQLNRSRKSSVQSDRSRDSSIEPPRSRNSSLESNKSRNSSVEVKRSRNSSVESNRSRNSSVESVKSTDSIIQQIKSNFASVTSNQRRGSVSSLASVDGISGVKTSRKRTLSYSKVRYLFIY